MQSVSPQMQAFIRNLVKTPTVFVKVQLPADNGVQLNSQLVFTNVESCSITRTNDFQSDTAKFAFTDNTFSFSSVNPNSRGGAAFHPGLIDNKFIVYLGFRTL